MQDLKPKVTLSILIRSLLFHCLIVLSILIGGVTIAPLALFCPKAYKYQLLTSWTFIPIFLSQKLCGLHYEIINPQNIPSEPCVVISNHQSAWETFLFPRIFPKQCWVIKKQLLNIPIWGWVFRLLDPIALDRKKKNSVNTLLEQGDLRLKENLWIIIFPEGTRKPPLSVGRYSRSATVLAEKTNSLILPVAHNAGNFWPKSSFIIWPGTIKIYIGEAFKVDAGKSNEVTAQLSEWALKTILSFEEAGANS